MTRFSGALLVIFDLFISSVCTDGQSRSSTCIFERMKMSVVFAGIAIILGFSVVSTNCDIPEFHTSCGSIGGGRLITRPAVGIAIGFVNAFHRDPNENLSYSVEGKHSKYVKVRQWGTIMVALPIPTKIKQLSFTVVVKDSNGKFASRRFVYDWCNC